MSIPFQPESFLILVVEDDRLSREILCRALIAEGYRVVGACNGEECLSIYQQQHPNLVLLDAMMPTMNGFDCCSQLLALPNAAQTPVIMVTGLEDTASVDWAFDAGATDYVTKPIHWPILRRRVRNLLEKRHFYQQLEQANQQLQQQAIVDGLTGLANRRYFDECLQREWKRSIRDRINVSLILLDIDYFKAYNDTYGHPAGDRCLQRVAQTLQRSAKRATDIIARYGGEEFAMILPSTGLDGAIEVASMVQANIQALAIPHTGGLPAYGQVTISQGIASTIAHRDGQSSALIQWADKALYHAKHMGRNAIAVYSAGQVISPTAYPHL